MSAYNKMGASAESENKAEKMRQKQAFFSAREFARGTKSFNIKENHKPKTMI